MKIFIICSKKNYGRVPSVKEKLENMEHEVIIPNCMNDPEAENKAKALGNQEHKKFKQEMYKNSGMKIAECDAVLVLNPNIGNDVPAGYIGGATFLEMYEAFMLGKKIYMANEVTQAVFADEVAGFNPIILERLDDLV